MADITSVDLARRAGEQLEQASPDLLRAMVQTFAQALMGAEADAICGAPYGQVSEDRVSYRNGYRDRRWDTRAGTIELAIPRLRQGSYFPEWLLERRRRAEQALISVVATSYLLSVHPAGGEARRDPRDHLTVQEPGQRAVQEPGRGGGGVPVPAAGRRAVPVRAGRCADHQGPRGRPHVDRARPDRHRVNAGGKREIPGFDVTSAEDGAGWLAFFRGLVALGLAGVVLVTSDAHRGLVAAIAATLPGASW